MGRRWLKQLGSLQLTIVALSFLMGLVLLCTLAQARMGTFAAVEMFMRGFLVWWRPDGANWAVPVFPGGALVGLVLLVNLTVALVQRFKFTAQKMGLWLVHTGLIVLVAGEFVTGAFQVDTRLTFEEGQTTSHLEHYRDLELAVVDTTDPAQDDVWAVPLKTLLKGRDVALPGTALSIRPKGFTPNADLRNRQDSDPPSPATAGIGPRVAVVPKGASPSDDEPNTPVLYVEPLAGGRSLGVWMLSSLLGAPQQFAVDGRTYRLHLRPQRVQLPYTLTLKKFSHDRYPGTDIPKNFSSLVRLHDPAKGVNRDVLISMNQPLRYDGKAFYQASFGKGDTLSILQVVENPGWLLPYVSTLLVSLGLLWHFGLMLGRALTRKKEA